MENKINPENNNTANENGSASNPINTELQQCRTELSTTQDKLARLMADFENFKRRSEKEKAQWMNSAQSVVLSDVIAIADDFDRALQEAKKSAAENQALSSWITGFELIHKSISKMLSKYGVEEMTDFSTFDPEKHEAIMHVDSPEHQSGAIVSVLQKGYLFKNSILRPAKVSVAR